MPGVVTNQAEQNALGAISPGNLRVRLFKNDLTPGDTVQLADLVEADFPGYAQVDVTGSMTPIATDAEGKATTSTGACTFTRAAGAGSQTVYGYYLVDTVRGLYGLQRLKGGPKVFDTPGQTLVLTITITVSKDV